MTTILKKTSYIADMKAFIFLSLMVCILLHTSCMPSGVVMLTNNQYEATTPKYVRIYLQDSELPAQCVKIAMIAVTFRTPYAQQHSYDWKKTWEKVRREAARLGCNGVYQYFESTDENMTTLNQNRALQDPSKRATFIGIRY